MFPFSDGDWIIVIRKVGDTTSRGTIIRGGMTEQQARTFAAERQQDPKWNCWAIHRNDY